MITISLTQGLGNQLFQYFFGESIRINFKDKVEVNYLQDLLPPDQLKMWEIFEVPINWIDENHLKKNFLFNLSPKARNFCIKLFKILNLNQNILAYDDNNFDLNLININQNIYLRGYWQNINFFKKSFNEILKNIKFKKDLDLNQLLIESKIRNFTNIVGVHVRGKDYLLKKNYLLKNNIGADYYINSMRLIKNILGNPIFLLFSDDQEYLKQMNLSKYFNCVNFIDISNLRNDDFQYLSQCDHFVIPNSTFSLWAFYLNFNPNKLIITPDTWYSFNQNSIEKYLDKKFLNTKDKLKRKSN